MKLEVGDTVRKRTATESFRTGMVTYIHPSGTWYKVRFSCPGGQAYEECFWTHDLRAETEDERRKRIEEQKNERQALRELQTFYYR